MQAGGRPLSSPGSFPLSSRTCCPGDLHLPTWPSSVHWLYFFCCHHLVTEADVKAEGGMGAAHRASPSVPSPPTSTGKLLQTIPALRSADCPFLTVARMAAPLPSARGAGSVLTGEEGMETRTGSILGPCRAPAEQRWEEGPMLGEGQVPAVPWACSSSWAHGDARYSPASVPSSVKWGCPSCPWRCASGTKCRRCCALGHGAPALASVLFSAQSWGLG